ncbi:transposase [Trinickia symbiotica]|uniref:Transposase n=1 Tax=Trinickia symbiotica TaxID=863227 RepID=A0A2N7WP56_9BURK|nr:transposase [Trinickia symbiotica]PMS31210.1 hypothetical protein C0Z20_28760 [Trinickia symbiotica]PPK41120.1 transposase [Trinickia symbiotica]
MSTRRRHFTDEFKREAVRLCNEPGAVVTRIARELGVDHSVWRRWVQSERGGAMEMAAVDCTGFVVRRCGDGFVL